MKTSCIIYQTAWLVGAVLILISIPLYRHHAVFYTLLVSGIALLCVGLVLWVRWEAGNNNDDGGHTRRKKELPVLANISSQQHQNPLPPLKSKTQPQDTKISVIVDSDASNDGNRKASEQPAPASAASEPAAPAPAPAPASEVASSAAAVKKKPTARKSSLKKSASPDKDKHRNRDGSGVKLSEKANVKEFSKHEPSDAVRGKEVRTVHTKGGAAAAAQAELLTAQAAVSAAAAVGSSGVLPAAFVAGELMSSPRQHFIYPTVEDIRVERERFANRPETIDIDRKRRTSMIREYAQELGHPRDGSLLPLLTRS